MSDRDHDALPSPDELLSALSNACMAEQWEMFADLCTRHQQTIADSFAGWRRFPPSIARDPLARDHRAQTLIAIATAFKDAGRPEFLVLLIGEGGASPLQEWQHDYELAESLVKRGDYESAIPLLDRCLGRFKSFLGPGVDHFLPRTHGLLGISYYHVGDSSNARLHTQAALEICRRTEDVEGLETYRASLAVIDAGR